MSVGVSDEMYATIQAELRALAQAEDVVILHACESGSRAWGFASEDSDYDVRFLYARPTKEYLRVTPPRDVIEKPIDAVLDISGWDVRKALQLFRKSNPPLLEWLQSPIVYLTNSPFSSELQQLAEEHFSARASFYHYLNMGKKQFDLHLQGELVALKKYFYVLRAVFACQWLEQGRGLAPITFDELFAQSDVPMALRTVIEEMRERKKDSREKDAEQKHMPLYHYLAGELERMDAVSLPRVEAIDGEILDRLLLRTLSHVCGERLDASAFLTSRE